MPVGLSPPAALTIECESLAISISYIMFVNVSLAGKGRTARRVISLLIGGLFRPKRASICRVPLQVFFFTGSRQHAYTCSLSRFRSRD